MNSSGRLAVFVVLTLSASTLGPPASASPKQDRGLWALGPIAPKKAPPGSELIERLRCHGEDAATCFVDRDHADAELALYSSDEEFEAMVAGILEGLEAHDTLQVQLGLEEMQAAPSQSPSASADDDPVTTASGGPELHLDLVDLDDFDFPIVLNDRVQAEMVHFLTDGRSWLVRGVARSKSYEPLVVPKLEAAGLPKTLVSQVVIESAFNPYAQSWVGALGIWQFMPATGRQYGMQSNWWVEERRDPVRATDSAVLYMSSAYKRFGKWELAAAAYNAGPGGVRRAIRKCGTDDFWELSCLPGETRQYVARIMAVAILSKYPDRYGLTAEIEAQEVPARWDHDVVYVEEATDLKVVASLLKGVELKELEAINPALRRGYTPPGVANYPLYLPRGKAKVFKRKYARLPASQRTTFIRHTVVRGDTLGALGRRHGVPYRLIMSVNGIEDPNKLRVGDVLVIPVRSATLAARSSTHVVSRGESLWLIAPKYGMTVPQLRELNGLESDVLQPGQKLKVRPGASGAS